MKLKRISIFKSALFSTMLLFAFSSSANAQDFKDDKISVSVKESDNYTFGEVERTLVDYLASKGKAFEIGSKEYTDFIIDQFDYNTDQELSKRPDYEAITAYISEYLYQISLYEAKNSPESVISPSNFNLKEIEDVTIGELKEQIATEEAIAETVKSNEPTLFATSTYSVSAAKNYASRWYNGRNPTFPVFTVDCTNFVSQILFAGGMPMNKSYSSGWYANVSDNSVSWSAVPEFYTYWSQKKSTVSSLSKATIIADSKAGDIVQFKKNGATRWSHSMFVYEKSNSTLYLSGHTSDFLKKDFKTISTDWTSFRVIKM